MSAKWMNQLVLDSHITDRTAHVVLLAIADLADDSGRADVSVNKLGQMARLTIPGNPAEAAIDHLIAQGAIRAVRPKDPRTVFAAQLVRPQTELS